MNQRLRGIQWFAAGCLLLQACSVPGCAPEPITWEQFDAHYDRPLPSPKEPLSVFYIGHSLVGRDLPAMVQQLAGTGHRYESELGWGATLKSHWEPDEPIPGFEEENAHPRYRDATQALDSGQYDALVLTEMVEIRDAIEYHDSYRYLFLWAERGWKKRPDLRVYLYETWHNLDDPDGWLERLDRDFKKYWEHEILARTMAKTGPDHTIYVIPAGQVMARFVREVEQKGGLPGIPNKEALFARTAEGKQDTIHLGDLGTYLVALTHFAVLYERSPIGLPHELNHADGSKAVAPAREVARLMQEIAWETVTHLPETGVPQRK